MTEPQQSPQSKMMDPLLPLRKSAVTASKLLAWALLMALLPLLCANTAVAAAPNAKVPLPPRPSPPRPPAPPRPSPYSAAKQNPSPASSPKPPRPGPPAPFVIKRNPTPPSPPSDALYICDPGTGAAVLPQGFRLYLDVKFGMVNSSANSLLEFSNDTRDALALVFKVGNHG